MSIADQQLADYRQFLRATIDNPLERAVVKKKAIEFEKFSHEYRNDPELQPHLEEISRLFQEQFNDPAVNTIIRRNYSKENKFVVYGSHFSDSDIITFLRDKFLSIEELTLVCTALTGECFSKQMKFPYLQRLGISGNVALNEKYLPQLLDNCPDLQLLDISNSSLTGAAFTELSELPWIRGLNFSGCLNLTDEYLSVLLAKCPLLQHLDVSHTKISVNAFEGVFPQLLTLRANCSRLTEQDIPLLQNKCIQRITLELW